MKVQISPEDIKKLDEVQSMIRNHNRIGAIIACTQFAYGIVQKTKPDLDREIFEDVVERMSISIYNEERRKLGQVIEVERATIKKGVQ